MSFPSLAVTAALLKAVAVNRSLEEVTLDKCDFGKYSLCVHACVHTPVYTSAAHHFLQCHLATPAKEAMMFFSFSSQPQQQLVEDNIVKMGKKLVKAPLFLKVLLFYIHLLMKYQHKLLIYRAILEFSCWYMLSIV